MNPVSKVQEAWLAAARELGIQVVCPFTLGAGNDRVEFHGMVVGFGSPKGTVFLASSTLADDVGSAARRARENGFYFSQINSNVYCDFKRPLFCETLKDWGWQNTEVVPPHGFKLPIRTEKRRRPNHSTEPAPTSGTSAAEHPPRQP